MASKDPILSLGDIGCANERILASLAIISDLMHEALHELSGVAQAEQLHRCWLLLDLTRTNLAQTDRDLDTLETALLSNRGTAVVDPALEVIAVWEAAHLEYKDLPDDTTLYLPGKGSSAEQLAVLKKIGEAEHHLAAHGARTPAGIKAILLAQLQNSAGFEVVEGISRLNAEGVAALIDPDGNEALVLAAMRSLETLK